MSLSLLPNPIIKILLYDDIGEKSAEFFSACLMSTVLLIVL